VILVTGGTGFVGPKVVHALRAEGKDVRVLARKPGSKPARTAASWGCEVVQGDMTDTESLRRAVESCDTVVHLVAVPPFAARQTFERVMIQGTRDLLAAAKESAVRRFVLMSALGTSEDTKNLTGYYAAKWDGEQAVKESGIDHVIFRPSFVFGPGGGVLAGAIKAVRFSPVVPVVAAERKLQPVWIEDVASFYAQSVSLEMATNRTFDLVGPDVVTWGELWTRIERVLGKRRANLRVPTGMLRGVAKVGDLLPPTRGASEAVTMLDYGDNVGEMAPAAETFGIQPVGLTEQIRRAV
jgi:uncharacterized protein YbjT (DUF2867 family)